MNHSHTTQKTRRFGWRWIIALAGFLIIAAFFLFSEHRAHFLGWLPLLLLLLVCPFLHLFMHGGHGGKNSGAGNNQNHNH